MSELSDLYNQISGIGGKAINKWVREVRKRIAKFSKNISAASPFKNKPTYQKDFRKGRFWITAKPQKGELKLYGTAPNAGQVKGFGAPVNKMRPVKPYQFKYPDRKPTFGRKRSNYGQGWVTYGKAQVTSPSAGIPIKPPHLFGERVKAVGYFGIGKYGYGRTANGDATPIYYESAFVDWMMDRHDDEIERIIMEAGKDVLGALLGGGK